MRTLTFRSTLLALVLSAGAAQAAAPPIEDARGRADIESRFDRRADVRVLNVWATWCAPCVAEMPHFQAIHERYARRGVSLVALSMDDALPGGRDEARRKVEAFVKSRALSFTNLLYVGSIPALENELGIGGEIPVTILFDRQGRELKRIEGVIDPVSFGAELDRLLERSSHPAR
jgi:thiol-disulfide isomerase/thioredoxin